jgi:hypothetical protein
MLRPQPAAYPASRVALWPLSYRCMEHRAGFEPATSRLAVEVTAIFTTDRDGVGGERAMLLLPLRAIRLSARRVRTCSTLSRLHHEVTDIFTTARPMLSHRPLMGTLGNRRSRLSVTTTQAPSLRTDPAPGRVQASPEVASRCVCQRRDSNPLYRGGSIRHLHHQRRLSRDHRGKPIYKNSVAALSTRRHLRTIWVRSAIGIRLIASFPPAGPAHLGTRLSSASPGIRVSRSGMCRGIRTGRAAGNKKPSGAAGSGGSVRSGLSILRSGKIAPMSRACAIDWP